MHVTEVTSQGLKRGYKVVVPKTHFDTRLNERLTQFGATAKVPGFRPGKIPLSILKQRYGSHLQGEVLEKTLQESVDTLLKEKSLKPALRPDVKIETFDDKNDLELTVSLEILPDFEVPDITSLALERLACAPSDKDIAEALERLASHHAAPAPLAKARASQKEDVLVIDFKGSIDGTPFPGGEGENVELELGSGSFIPGFEDQLLGKKEGDLVDVQVTFPKDYPETSLAGKEASFKTTVKKIQTKIAPDLNDDFAVKLGLENFEKLKELMKTQIERERNRMGFLVAKRLVLDTLAEKPLFEVPEGLVNTEFDTIWQQYQAQLGGDNDEPGKAKKPSEKELAADKKQYRDIAVRRVRLGLILSEIGRQYDITVTKKELESALVDTARQYPGQEEKVFAYFKNNQQAVEGIKAPLFEDKVVGFILDKAKTKTKEVPLEDLLQAVKNVTEGDEDEAS